MGVACYNSIVEPLTGANQMTITEFGTKHNISIVETKSVPLQPGEKGFRYSVTLQLAGKGSFVTVPYFCGSAYVGTPYYVNGSTQNSFGGYNQIKKWKMLSYEDLRKYENKVLYEKNAQPIPPQLDSVLGCLLCDFSLLTSAPFWPEYAFELGLNEDSIKERTKYDESVKQLIAFRKMVGYLAMNEFLSCDSE